MPTPLSKPKRAAAWLPTQVAYGMDCSDDDPKNWKAFGYVADELEQLKASAKKPVPSAP